LDLAQAADVFGGDEGASPQNAAKLPVLKGEIGGWRGQSTLESAGHLVESHGFKCRRARQNPNQR